MENTFIWFVWWLHAIFIIPLVEICISAYVNAQSPLGALPTRYGLPQGTFLKFPFKNYLHKIFHTAKTTNDMYAEKTIA